MIPVGFAANIREAVMRLPALGAAIAFASFASPGSNAADFDYYYEYSAPRPPAYVNRGAPLPPPQDLVAPAPTPKVVPRESLPRTTPAPQLTCTRVWRCDEYDDCAWKSVCKPRPEPAPVRYESPRPP